MKNRIKSSFKNVLRQPMLWALTVIAAVIILSLLLIPQSSDPNGAIRASLSSSVVLIGGYFMTHYLTKERELRQRRLEQCLALIKGLRFLMLETRLRGKDEENNKLIDELQNSYYGFSLVARSNSYELLRETIEKFGEHLKKQTPRSLSEFKEKQKEFVNQIRSDFFNDEEIDFETYDIKH